MIDTKVMKALNEKHWALAHIIQRFPETPDTATHRFDAAARKLLASKARYQAVADKTGVPWFVIAVIHNRESSGSFTSNLANGEPLNRITTKVPKGRGPYKSWEDSAIDALTNCPPYAAKNKDWSVGGTLTLLELYNGPGYFKRGLPSPYLWANTSEYQHGKYTSDGVFNPDVVDQQLGCAGIIKVMMTLDPTIQFDELKKKTCLTRLQSFLNSISR